MAVLWPAHPWLAPGFTLAGGWQACTLLSPWHDALRRFYSEPLGCEVNPQAAITATKSTRGNSYKVNMAMISVRSGAGAKPSPLPGHGPPHPPTGSGVCSPRPGNGEVVLVPCPFELNHIPSGSGSWCAMPHQGTQEVTRARRPLAAMVGSGLGRAPVWAGVLGAPGLGTSFP